MNTTPTPDSSTTTLGYRAPIFRIDNNVQDGTGMITRIACYEENVHIRETASFICGAEQLPLDYFIGICDGSCKKSMLVPCNVLHAARSHAAKRAYDHLRATFSQGIVEIITSPLERCAGKIVNLDCDDTLLLIDLAETKRFEGRVRPEEEQPPVDKWVTDTSERFTFPLFSRTEVQNSRCIWTQESGRKLIFMQPGDPDNPFR
jgi:hypothetical protein